MARINGLLENPFHTVGKKFWGRFFGQEVVNYCQHWFDHEKYIVCSLILSDSKYITAALVQLLAVYFGGVSFGRKVNNVGSIVFSRNCGFYMVFVKIRETTCQRIQFFQ